MSDYWKRFTRLILLVLNGLTIIPLILAMAGSYLPPDIWWAFPIATFALPEVIITPAIWVIIWFRRSYFYSFVNLSLILLNFTHLSATFQYNPSSARSAYTFKVYSHNVEAFRHKKAYIDTMITFFKNKTPDILCLQEFDNPGKKEDSVIHKISKALNLKHFAFQELIPKSEYGLIILSKYPIVKSERVGYAERPANNGAMFADIKLYSEVVRVYNMHFTSYSFTKEQREWIGFESGSTRKIYQLNFRKIWGVIKVMLNTWRQQKLIYQAYKKNLDQLKTNYHITCCDLNNTPYHYFYRQLNKRSNDCFREKGRGLGYTFVSGKRKLRIDYIFASPRLYASAFTTHSDVPYSTHRGLSVALKFDFHH